MRGSWGPWPIAGRSFATGSAGLQVELTGVVDHLPPSAAAVSGGGFIGIMQCHPRGGTVHRRTSIFRKRLCCGVQGVDNHGLGPRDDAAQVEILKCG